MQKTILGLIEKIKINGKELKAKIDTGAQGNSIDIKLAQKLRLGPIIKTYKIKTSAGHARRPAVRAHLEIKGRKFNTIFNVSDRKHMEYPVLIGRRILKKGFLVDVSK